jgi:hypothetical protein
MEQADSILLSNTREWLRRTKEDLDAAALVLTVSSRWSELHCLTLSKQSKRQ